MELLQRFQQYMQEQKIGAQAYPTLLAVSGGMDSMVLMHLYHAAGLTFGVAHCNFQLRAEASDLDEAFVRETAHAIQAPFFSKRFDTKEHADLNGISTQMAARDLRYVWFEQTARAEGFKSLATAHHLNDSVETALLNFVRGTGLAGMLGIQQVSAELPIIRPLLPFSRDEILEYAVANGIAWREDSSNASDDYKRNFLRHQVIPKMTDMNPGFLHTAARNMQRFKETKDNFDFLLQQYFAQEKLADNAYSIDKQKLAAFPAPRLVLHELIKPYGFTEEQARQMAENLEHVGLTLDSGTGWQLRCDRLDIQLRPPTGQDAKQPAIPVQRDDLMLRLPDGTSLLMMPTTPTAPYPDGKEAILVDAGRLQYPLHLRRWEEGDSFQPFGMGGQHQKLQDLFTNEKLSRTEKETVWLLLNGDGNLIWVVGIRLDERFKVGEHTENALKISWVKPS